MNRKSSTFHESSRTIWNRLNEKLHGKFIEQEGWRFDKIVAEDDGRTVTIDIHSEPHYRHEALLTRFRAPYANPAQFRFNIYRKTFFGSIATLLGLQDVKSGYDDIDTMFILQTNDPQRLKRLLDDETLRTLLSTEPEIHLHVRDSGNWFDNRPEVRVDELVLEVEGRVKQYDRLEKLYNLFSLTLHQLCDLDGMHEH